MSVLTSEPVEVELATSVSLLSVLVCVLVDLSEEIAVVVSAPEMVLPISISV
jgi:hypothetical protein